MIPETIGMLSHISELWLSDNKLSGQIPSTMRDLHSLKYLFLDSNKFTKIQSDAFSGLRLNVLDLGNQTMSLSPLELEPGAFRNCTSGNKALISLAPNYVPSIPGNALDFIFLFFNAHANTTFFFVGFQPMHFKDLPRPYWICLNWA